MPLTTYAEADAFKFQIKHSVEDKHMPPWPPDPAYSRLAHERLLSQAEIDKIVSWEIAVRSQVLSPRLLLFPYSPTTAIYRARPILLSPYRPIHPLLSTTTYTSAS